jgi:hypothetical protein
MKQVTGCRYCHQELSYDEPREPFLLQLACPQCAYVNVVEKSTMLLPLEGHTKDSSAFHSSNTTDDPQKIEARLKTIANELLQLVVERIGVEYTSAQNALISLMSRRESILQDRIQNFDRFDISPGPRMFNRVVELLFATLSLTAAEEFCSKPSRSTDGVARFLKWFQPLAEEVVTIASFTSQLRRKELKAILSGNVLTFTKTNRHAQSVECYANKQAKEKHLPKKDEGFEIYALRCQQLALGFSATDLYDLAENDFHRLRKDAHFETIRGVTFIDVEASNSSMSRMLGLCSLTSERLKIFRAPFFFDTGGRVSTQVTAETAILNGIAYNWSYYYPFFSFCKFGDLSLKLATTRGILVAFFSNLESQKNSVVDRLLRSARENKNEQVRKEVERIVIDASKALEEQACGMARACGWSAAHGPNSLPCGDIDGLFARLNGTAVTLVVAEVKSADLVGHRPDTYDTQSELVEKAVNQLAKKAKWVADNWNRGFAKNTFGDAIGSATKGTLLKILITRERQPLELVADVECIAIDELRGFLKNLQPGVPNWFRDARRSSILDFELVV